MDSLAIQTPSRPASSFTLSEEESAQLPPKHQPRLLRHARHTFLNVYRRLFSLVFLVNMIGLGFLLSRNRGSSSAPLSDLSTAASANIMVAILIRQDYIINVLYWTCWCVPLSAPLRVRRIVAKFFEHGGVHSGAAFCSTIWFSVYIGFFTREFASGRLQDPSILTLTYVLIILLFALVITAYPSARSLSHNTFENVHRWGGWFALALFWAELVLFARSTQRSVQPSTSLHIILIQTASFWFLLISSVHVILPWLRLHKLYVEAEHLSKHVVRLHIKEKTSLYVTFRISDSPLREWHSFAYLPNRNGDGGSFLISDAGDWTRKAIGDPKDYYYVKGVPVLGMLCMAQVFSKVVIVTTGSGIGPCLGFLIENPHTTSRVLWSTRNPWQTYGDSICNDVLAVDPSAMIIDTDVVGRLDLLQLAYELYVESGAEAVFCISNPKLTRKVVYGLESRGVPAFGPIWDS